MRATIAKLGGLIAMVPVVCANAQGVLPVPDVTGASLDVSVERVSGTQAFGDYLYRYAVANPAASTGDLWLLKVDVSARSRADEDLNSRYPVQGGAVLLLMRFDADRLTPFFGRRGNEVVVVVHSYRHR